MTTTPQHNHADGAASVSPVPARDYTILDHALAYANHGWPVFPIIPNDKRPLTANGFKDATMDPARIRYWWEQCPDANIGTPVPADVLVVDVDVQNGGTLAQLGDMPQTVTARTGGGGWHLWTSVPRDVPLTGKFRDLTGIDVRKEGNYVVLPPSSHKSGRRYEWEPGHHPFTDNVPIAPLPAHLLDRVRAPVRQQHVPRPATHDEGADYDPDKIATYFLTRATERAADDGRNNTGLWLACQLRDNGVSIADAERILLDYQAEVETWSDPPYTSQEALNSLQQAYNREAREPTTFSEPRSAPAAVVRAAHATGDPKALERLSQLPEAERLSDLGDAALLEAQYCRVLKHTPELGWLAYRDGKWDAADGEKTAYRCVRRVLEGLATQAAGELGTDHGKKLFAHAHQACNRVPYITRAAESFERLSAHQADFDADPFLLGVKNGVVDLRTGELRPHDPALLLSHQSPVAFHPDARAPRWERFLHEVFAGDTDQICFVQKAVGYSLTGDTREQVFFLCHGSGANGKSVFLSTLSYVAGDYAAPLNPEEFMARFNRAETQPNLVGVVGRRLVTSQEPKDGSAGEKAPALDAARVKWLTGGDAIQIRTLHAKPFFYQPIWKLWLAMNRLPDIRDDSDGIWRRLRPIPFTVSFRGREDPTLTATLRDEAEGILAWCVEGARIWLADKEGLGMVAAVQNDVDAYRAREDPLFAFIQRELVKDAQATVSQQEVLMRYEHWRVALRDDYDAPYYSPRDFGRALDAKGIERRKRKNGRVLVGYRLRTEAEKAADDAADDAQVTMVTHSTQIAGIPIGLNYIGKPANDPPCVTSVTLTRDPPGDLVEEQPARLVPVLTPRRLQVVDDDDLLPPDTCGHLVHAPAKNGSYRCDGCGSTWTVATMPVGMRRYAPDGFDRWDGVRWQHEAPQRFGKSAA